MMMMRPSTSALLSLALISSALASSCDLPYNASGLQIWGLASAAAGAASAAACAAACCADANCAVYQFCPGGAPASPSGCGSAASCWIGPLGGQIAHVPGWVSFAAVPVVQNVTFINATLPPVPATDIGVPPSTSPSGHVLSIDSASLLLDGRRILPFAGEMHFSRVPRASWSADLAAMKAGGLDVVQAYVFWLHTEEIQGAMDWTDNRALGEFVDECAAAGLMVNLRIGPWCHGEARNGGWPDWVGNQTGVRVRTNTTAWMNIVRPWYEGVAAQTKGKYWADGGPIISVQVDNETPDVDYVLALRDLAQNVGINPFLFIKTGWPTPSRPVDPAVLFPVSGGYFDEFWTGDASNSTGGFTFGSHRNGTYPIVTAESGPGMASSYHRRIHIDPLIAGTAIQTFLANGVAQLGMYMSVGCV